MFFKKDTRIFCLIPYFVFHVRVVYEGLMRFPFFLGYFFLRTLDCLVSNCSRRNSQFIGIKFTLLPLPPSCLNVGKKVCVHVWISIFVKWSVKLSDLPVFRSGNHWETIISKSIAVSYPGIFMIHDKATGSLL